MAGVSKRTVDYYTNLGLLKPVRSETNYRYYTAGCLARLKMIKALKMQRLTLEEIKEELSLFDDNNPDQRGGNGSKKVPSMNMVRKQIRQLEDQLAQLQPVLSGDKDHAVQLKNSIMLQSMALVQTLTLYMSEITSYL